MTAQTKKKPGRKRIEFDQTVADRICDMIIEGKSLRRICAMKAMPTKKTVLRWLDESPGFQTQYARAREEQAEGYADELVELAKKANSENAQAIRVRADIIKWACSKLKPKKYGDRLAIDADVKVEQTPGWARSLYNVTAHSPAEQRLVNWPREDKFERGRRLLSELHGLGIELEQHWGIPNAAQTCLDLCMVFEGPMDRVIDGKPAFETPQPLALPAPQPGEPAEREINPAPDNGPTTRARDDDVEVI